MSAPWGFGPKYFTIPDTADRIVRLDVPHRGTITGINLRQVDGTDGGVFEIYDSAAVVPDLDADAASSYSIESETVPADFDPNTHSITAGEVAIVSGVYVANNLDIPYINRDGTPTNPVRHLWLRINSAGSGGRYALSMTIKPASLDG